MKKYLFIVLLVGVCFGQKYQSFDDVNLFIKAIEITKLKNEEGVALFDEIMNIFNFQKNNGSFGQGSFHVIMSNFMDLNKILNNISNIAFYYAEIEKCGGSNEYTIKDLKNKLENLEGYIVINKDAINGESQLLKNEYSISKLADDIVRYLDKLQKLIDK